MTGVWEHQGVETLRYGTNRTAGVVVAVVSGGSMMTYLDTAQCSSRVHKFYATRENAEAVAKAKSRDGQYYVARKCLACSGWRISRVG